MQAVVFSAMLNQPPNPAESAHADVVADQLANPAESAPASIVDVVAIRGGGIPLDESMHLAWVVNPEIVEGRRFVEIYAADCRCRAYFQQKFAMVNHIKALRDRKALELMRALAQEEDLNETNVAARMPDRPKRELIDQIASIIDIEVCTRNGVQATVSVIPSWRNNKSLQIELSQENMDLLLEEPPDEPAPFNPAAAVSARYPNVHWLTHRNAVRCTWYDSKKKKSTTTSRNVEFEPDADNEEKLSLVMAVAKRLQRFYEAHHNLDCDDSYDSAESAHESLSEPRRKKQGLKKLSSAESAHASGPRVCLDHACIYIYTHSL